MTKQEMLNRAVFGLRSQGFRRCMQNGEPAYADTSGCRCAWGWVDTSIQPGSVFNAYFVAGLAADGVGVAATLDLQGLAFARQLQQCHDEAPTPSTMERRLRQLALREDLAWPE